MSAHINNLLENPNSIKLILEVQKAIHLNFTEELLEDMTPVQLDKHLFERTNLAMEELFEANCELKHRKPHRVTCDGVAVDANKAVTDLNKYKSELMDAFQIITSILGGLGMTEEEFYTLWRTHVDKVKNLSIGTKYSQSEIMFDYKL